MSTLRTTNVIHGSSAIRNIVLDNQGRAIFGPDSPQGRAALYVNAQNNRVGVNTESPSVALDVAGAINATGNVAFGGTFSVTGSTTLTGLLEVGNDIRTVGWNGTTALGFRLDSGGALLLNQPGTGASLSIRRNGTENAFINGAGQGYFASNLGIGTTSPNKPLHIFSGSSDAEIRLQTNSGTEQNSYITLRQSSGDLDLYTVASGTNMKFYTVNVERMRLDSNGRLIIGTEQSDFGSGSPGDLLQVSSGSGGHILLGRTATSVAVNNAMGLIRGYSYAGGTWGESGRITIQADGNQGSGNKIGRITFATTGLNETAVSEKMRLTHHGVLSIGTGAVGNGDGVLVALASGSGAGTTNTRLFMSGYESSSGNSAGLWFGARTDENTGVIGARTASGNIAFEGFESGAWRERMRINSAGNVGIGETSPLVPLHIRRNSTATSGIVPGIRLKNGSSTNSNRLSLTFASINDFDIAAVNGVIESHAGQATNAIGRLEFYTRDSGSSSPTERVRITNDGETFTYAETNGWNIRTGSAANTSNTILQGAYDATGVLSGGITSIFIYSNGDIKNANNSYTGISDAKLKENIVDASSQWDDIKNLRVRNYNFIEGQTHTQIGLVAQEVESVSPGLVAESIDFDDDGNDLGTVTKSVNYSVLYMKAVKALQEAMERIESLETRIATLENS